MKRRLPTIRALHVTDIELPRELEQLYELAYNLWWTWNPEARALFASIDGAKWARYRNPVQLLINIEPRHWYPLLESDDFLSRYHRVVRRFEKYLEGSAHAGSPTARPPKTWFGRHHREAAGELVAYFSMEYGLHQSLAIYSGGLGVLSGDHAKAASDLGVPLVAVGLLYRHGYFRQTLNAEGVQQHTYPEYDFTRLPLRPIAGATGREVTVSVRLPGRDVHAKLWLAWVGRIPLILLDTDVPENDPADRPITNQLYVGGREMRLLQEIFLGLGGVKAIAALGIEPTVWHMNEGHSALLQLERLRREVTERGRTAEEARARISADAIFTTHTPVAAGNEQFDHHLIRKYFRAWCDEVGLTIEELFGLGRDHGEGFNLTALAIRHSSWANAVSRLNAEVTSRMWEVLLAERASDGSPAIHPITNGAHAPTWIGRDFQELLRRRLDPDWVELLLEPGSWKKLLDLPDAEVWATHMAQKERLGRFTRSRLRGQHARYGAAPDELKAIGGLFDPSALTIGFARRFATYKRASLVFSDLRRLEALLCDEDRPVQLLFAGKAHPADRPGQNLIQHIFELSRSRTFAGRVIFLENYDIRTGRMLVQGVDVWLNTPRRPLEASGTSGMKAAMNGGLNFSIADGWWPEGFEKDEDGGNGWVIGEARDYGSEEEQDREDVASLYHTLETVILPLYYERDEEGLPRAWIAMMKRAMASLTPRFSASRMVRDYVEQGYLPAAQRRRDVLGAGVREPSLAE
jgi:starch phosphorylase